MRRLWPTGGCRARNKQTNLNKSTNNGVNKSEIFSILPLFSLMLAKYSPYKFVVCVSCNMLTVMYDGTVSAHRFSQVHTVVHMNISLRHTIIHVQETKQCYQQSVTDRSIHPLCRSRTSPQSTTRSPEIRADC